jgi:YHS domain-containing protein
MKRMFAVIGLAGAISSLAAASSLAGEQYVDASGFAVSGYDVVAFFDKEQKAVGERQPAPTPGRADTTAEWNGATFAFANEANRDRFVADPAAFAPAYDGHCAFGVAKGGKVPGDPQFWRIVDGTLYLNLQQSVATMWEEDIPGNLDLAEANWPGIEPAEASERPVPELDVAAAPIRN